MAEQITVAFVYGSVAKGTDTTRSDVDLMVISNDLAYAELFAALQGAEERIGRRVNPNLLTTGEWRKKRAEESHFVNTIAAQVKIFILGSVNDLD